MFGEDYAYAVARIRVLETGLLNQAAIEQLLERTDLFFPFSLIRIFSIT